MAFLDPGRREHRPERQAGGTGDRFVVISDRTGGARPGVFERGLAATDLLAPDFAVQLGDLIEGYSHDATAIEAEWEEIDDLLAATTTPILRVPGNHDVANEVQLEIWRRRYGPTYGFHRRGDLLFCLLDTQDPPIPYENLERAHDWDGTQPAQLSEAQLDFWAQVWREHRDVRWTFVFLHMPLWQGRHPAWTRLRRSLGNRPYTAFAGHVHNYRHQRIGGRSHLRLGPTGGGWVRPGPEGNFDQVTHVSMTDRGPAIATIVLDGLRDLDGRPLEPLRTNGLRLAGRDTVPVDQR